VICVLVCNQIMVRRISLTLTIGCNTRIVGEPL